MAAFALAVTVGVAAVLGFSQVANAATGPKVDPDTTNSWSTLAASSTSTKNIGRIWTDKSVFDTDYTPSGSGQVSTVEKDDSSDFLVVLSALASTSNTTTSVTVGTPVDVVLVLDDSGSMTYGDFGDGMTRGQALQEAADRFIGAADTANQGVPQENQIRMSIVTYSDLDATGVVCDWEYVTDEGTQSLYSAIDGLKAHGATRTDEGLSKAAGQLNGARQNAEKVVILFTDGSPTGPETPVNTFNCKTGAAAVNTAKSMKDGGATIYTIGIMDDADPSADDRPNNFLNAVSSNFPAATATGNNGIAGGLGSSFYVTWGEGSRDNGYYKTAENSDELNQVFDDIFDKLPISEGSGSPIEEEGALNPGTLTFTDPLGSYMEVTGGTMTVVYGNQKFTSKEVTTAGNVDTYHFEGTVSGNAVYKEANLSELTVTVTRSDDLDEGDVVTAQIPASLIPMRNYNVDADTKTLTVTDAYPIRLFYNVSVKQGAAAAIEAGSGDVYAAILNSQRSDDGTTIDFYSNAYVENAPNGSTEATFTPSEGNKFYYYTQDTPLYVDKECHVPATSSNIGQYDRVYYADTYWKTEDGITSETTEGVAVLSGGDEFNKIKFDQQDQAYIPAQTQRTDRPRTLISDKDDFEGGNVTGTALNVLVPGWNDDGSVSQSLGNNGKISYPAPVTAVPSVTKSLTGATLVADQFSFTLSETRDVDGGMTLPADSTATNAADGSVTFGSLMFSKPGTYEVSISEAIPDDATNPNVQDGALKYSDASAADQGAPGWTKDGVIYDGHSVTLTYVVSNSNGILTVSAPTATGSTTFTNTYEATGTMPLTIIKTLQNRPFQEGDSFGFTVTQDEKNPKDGATLSSDSVTIAYDADDGENTTKKTADPLTVTFSQQGDYTFYVSETVPDDATNPGVTDADGSPISYKDVAEDQRAESGWTYKGVTYDNQAKTVSVSVSDDGKGTLTANPASATVDFTNTYSSTGTTTVDTEAAFGLTKKFTGTPWDGQEFEFTITPSDGAPAPKDASGNDVTSIKVSQPDQENGDTAALDFGTLTFDQDDKGKTYTYTIQETEGTNLGIDYDTAQRVVTVYVFDDHNGGLGTTVTLTQGDKVISNTYGTELDYDAQGGIQIVKNLTGHDIEAGQFEFTLTPADKASAEQVGLTYDEATQTAESKSFSTHGAQMSGEGTATETIYVFDQQQFTLDFDQSDDRGTFTYRLTESKGGDASQGYVNDTRTYTVTITVADDSTTGVLEAKTVVDDGTGAEPATYVSNNNGTSQAAQVVFNNSYNPETTLGGQGSASIVAHKELLNGEMAGSEFSFVVKDAAGDTVTTGTNEADGTITFDPVTYDVDKLIADATADEPTASYDAQTSTYSYVYTVTEDTTSLPSYITPGAASAQVTVNVTDDGNGHLTCSVDYGNQQSGLTFVNTYGENQPQVISLAGFKMLNAEPGLTKPDIEGKFTFTLSGTDEKGSPAPLPVDDRGNTVSSATNDSAGNVSFGTITFTMESVFGDEPAGSGSDAAAALQPRSKTYTYKVTESGSVTGVTNDTASTKTFTVTVTDNRQGGLSVACTDSDGNVLQPGALFSFTNTYDVPSVTSTPTSGGITITKQLSGRALNKDEFSFEMRDASGDVVSTGTNAADGTVALSPVEFSLPGTYEYAIHEVKGSLGGVSYDDAVYYATATVEQNVDDATLSVTWKVSATQGGDPLTSVAFENAYEPAPVSVTLGGAKVLDGRELEAGEFSFVLKAPDGSELEAVTNTDRGGFAFSPITYSGPGTYEYTISEVKGDAEGVTYDDATYAVKVVVTDDGQGQLQVSELTYNGEASLPVFTNTYAAPEGPAPTIPETGDTTNAAVPVLVAVVGTAVIVVAVIAWRRRR